MNSLARCARSLVITPSLTLPLDNIPAQSQSIRAYISPVPPGMRSSRSPDLAVTVRVEPAEQLVEVVLQVVLSHLTQVFHQPGAVSVIHQPASVGSMVI